VLNQKEGNKKKEKEEAEFDSVSTISLIQANRQHSMAASVVFTRTVVVKGIDMALTPEPWYPESRIMGLTFQAIPCSVGAKQIDLEQWDIHIVET
jgi:hypothetical protein